jgi:benzoyl-CoA 2,3-epoxidase subunit B
MFVGESGVERVVQRTAELMKQDANEDVRAQGGIDLETIQRYVNFWFSSSLDLFGGEISSNAADYFATGLKGRAKEEKYPDHVALVGAYDLEVFENGRLVGKQIPMRNAMNEVVRDAYVEENQKGVDRWNRIIKEAGVNFEIRLPSRRFNRKMGIYSGHFFDPAGNSITDEEFNRRRFEWLPGEKDKIFVKSLMQPVLERGKMAHWIAAPNTGINGKPIDFEYIRKA